MPSSGWKLLTLKNRSKSKQQCPKLFYRLSISPSDGLELLLTDLISLWRCHKSNFDIIATAAEEHVSIDPSESEEQMGVLIDKIASSLSDGSNKLAIQAPDDVENMTLTLKTAMDLPKPLKPLEWIFSLVPQSASELAEQILRPTLHELAKLQERLDSLFDILKEKDHVIERLLDRVADKGIDMSLIFPTLTGTAKRGGGVKVEDAKKMMPGLKTFDRKIWEKVAVADEKEETDGMGFDELVKGCEKCFVHSKAEHDGWIQRLPGMESLEPGTSKSSIGRSQSQSQSQLKGPDNTESENEFETQVTPPDLKRKSADLDEDTSEDYAQRVAKIPKIAKIGGLGQRKQPNKLEPKKQVDSSPPVIPAHTSSPAVRHQNTDPTLATDTESENDEAAARPHKKSRLGGLQKKQPAATASKLRSPERESTPSRSTTPNSNASTLSRRLGRIGKARDRTATASPVPETDDQDGDQQTQRSQTATPRKLGRLGMRKKEGGTESPSSLEGQHTIKDHARQDANDSSDNHDSDATASPPTSPSPSKLEPRKEDTNTSPDKAGEKANTKEQSPSADPDPESGPEPETAEQKAARRREELKRTMQSSGAKKKRRF